ncbi:MAG: hypothetical protein HY868_25505 [Chloroflexi bacterium]|nr:hypothetical protein [Chloroflexota bacterium]
MEAKFFELLTINKRGQLDVRGSAELTAVQQLMRETGMSNSKPVHEMMGAGVREPIRLLSRYKEWAFYFFQDWNVTPGEDNRIPVDHPIGTSFITSPEARPYAITPGTQLWVVPSFFEVKGMLRMPWRLLKTAAWPILQRRLEEVSDDMSRKRDNGAKAAMDLAIATTTGHTFSSTGGKLNKSAVDAAVTAAMAVNFPITQMALNPARLTDMAGWTNGSMTAIPFFWGPDSKKEEVYSKLYADGYAGLRYVLSHNIPVDEVFLSGEPSEVGYHQMYGQAESASDVNIEDGVDLHVVREDHSYYVGNPYNLWKINITA